MNAQIIERNGKPEWAVIPYEEFLKFQELIEDAEDIKDIETSFASQESAVPGEVTFAIIDGVHPIRAWREYKKIKINELAKRIEMSGAYLSQIETGKRNPTIETLRLIARALELDIDLLI
ncbi:MAG: helix-turn-helix transcriptional regulator [Candidatus Marinimicrobia bacterium]|nr:helix-turn-helix transcriptional regulator [Candidatus Neomarinimicrobiota bacterium]MCF7922969.1 helix-turn-helix transcriptional regulator [Candidatus Neomarinimicrobiota bacterium]